ncbi:MAG: nickel pincer cofactor biosynthesis protein LarB [Coriobacteriales bacterium]|nr:nickel pincer cofactor biosynthesis protein LarB [Coriobacteriales bacterium]
MTALRHAWVFSTKRALYKKRVFFVKRYYGRQLSGGENMSSQDDYSPRNRKPVPGNQDSNDNPTLEGNGHASQDNPLLGFADLDFDRAERCGFPEVVFGLGKSAAQVAAIMEALISANDVVLCTRAQPEAAAATIARIQDAIYIESAGILFIDRRQGAVQVSGRTASEILSQDGGSGQVVVCCAGTSDLNVAEEAALTARIMGSKTRLITDIGIAGIHRALNHFDDLRSARAIVAVAGMEGALPTLVAGMVSVPVIAVPTSVGYGASFGGIAALLGMLNSCANGVSVVNIDNGFGAGVIAHRINLPDWLSTVAAVEADQ